MLPAALPNIAAWCDCGVAGNQPLLVMPSASISRWGRSSVITSKCSKAARREFSFAEQQCTYDLLEGLCSTMQAPIFREEVGAKLITSRQRFGPYIARAFATSGQLYGSNNAMLRIVPTEYSCPGAFQGIFRVLVLHAMQNLARRSF